MDDTEKKDIKDQISSAIKSGQVKMRPKWYFILATMIYSAAILILALIILFLISFVIFILHQSGVWFAPSMGWGGWFSVLIYFPWLPLALVLFFLIILEVLAAHFSLVYRNPIVYSAIIIVILAAVMGYVFAQTPLHSYLHEQAKNGGLPLPLAGRLYRAYDRREIADIHRGKIMEINPDGFTMADSRQDDYLSVIILPITRLNFRGDFLPGEAVVVFGSQLDHTIRAQAINRLLK